MSSSPFNGFPKETILFFAELAVNNNKTWFTAHKPNFEKYVMTPARNFVGAMGERLQELSPGINADPRVNKSIFRIYRDTRFSKDKTPYKTNLGLWFWVGEGAKFENPGYYFHLDVDNLMLGVGLHSFSKPILKAYRDAVVDPEFGPALAEVVTQVAGKGYGIGQKTYKRVPRNYDPDHPNAELLLYSGLTGGIEIEHPEALHAAKLVDYCFEHYRKLEPVVNWLQTMIERFVE
ncbi:MAG: DUF2461 domain-containing protein [Anaerolineales bacterium]|nr:DUF2461 domain-containing protein [Chloroflexota bacterium]MBL6980856.1 DUF2461 domain-containing protein [Anaerolineales bacterium]